jgi:hypothetical protein
MGYAEQDRVARRGQCVGRCPQVGTVKTSGRLAGGQMRKGSLKSPRTIDASCHQRGNAVGPSAA